MSKKYAQVPGRLPEPWTTQRYNPKTEEEMLALYGVPLTGISFTNMAHRPDISKPVMLFKNEIESALLESDLDFQEVDEVMAMLPHMELVFQYLEERGEDKTVHLLYRLLAQ